MTKPKYAPEFKAQALSKARQRGTRTLQSVADELNMTLATLKGWLQASNRQSVLDTSSPLSNNLSANDYAPAQRLALLLQSHGLSSPRLHAWCRERGLFTHQLQAWDDAFCAVGEPVRQRKATLRELQQKNEQLKRDLNRKDRALAETSRPSGAAKKVPGVVAGRGHMIALQQRQTLLALIRQACDAGARLAMACRKIVGWQVFDCESAKASHPSNSPCTQTTARP